MAELTVRRQAGVDPEFTDKLCHPELNPFRHIRSKPRRHPPSPDPRRHGDVGSDVMDRSRLDEVPEPGSGIKLLAQGDWRGNGFRHPPVSINIIKVNG